MGSARVYAETVEVLSTGDGHARVYAESVEVLLAADSVARVYVEYVETLSQVASSVYDESPSSTLSLTHAVVFVHSIPLSASSTLTLTHSIAVSQAKGAESILVLTDLAEFVLRKDRSVTSTLVLTDLAESITYHDRSVESILVFTQFAARTAIGIAENTLDLTDEAIGIKLISRTCTSTLALSQAVARELTLNRTVSQGLPITQTLVKTISRVLSVTTPIVLSQSVTYTLTKLALNTLVLTQDATYNTGKHIHQSVELTQTVAVSPVYNRSLFSVFIPFQTISVNTSLNKAISQTLSLAQQAIGYVVKSASNILVLTQSATGVAAKAASNTLALSQIATFTRVINKTVIQPITLVQTVIPQKSYAVQAVSYLGFNQFARGTRQLNQSATSTLAIVQELIRDLTLEDIDHTLSLVQNAECMKVAPRTVENALALTQSVSVATTINRSVTSTLTFLTNHDKYTGISGHPIVNVPNVQVTLIKKGTCLVILQNGSLVIVLPCPEFGDLEGGTGTINIKRSMSGGRRVYKKESPTSRLNYQFVIDRKKAIELRNFILQSNTAFLRMENWKGEIWAVQMTNSPFSFGEDAAWLESPGGNRSSITLEFEGVKLN